MSKSGKQMVDEFAALEKKRMINIRHILSPSLSLKELKRMMKHKIITKAEIIEAVKWYLERR